ncbi:MAG: MGMT family protein [Vicinamibacteraceae bacterium]
MRESTAANQATPFTRRVVAIVRSIPSGRLATYGDVAVMAGRAGAARAVGNVMRHCEDPSVPCHRVIGAGGALGGYTDPQRKKQRLAAEGVTFAGRRVRRFADLRWADDGAATPRRRRPV